jgi:hypothetical protein
MLERRTCVIAASTTRGIVDISHFPPDFDDERPIGRLPQMPPSSSLSGDVWCVFDVVVNVEGEQWTNTGR